MEKSDASYVQSLKDSIAELMKKLADHVGDEDNIRRLLAELQAELESRS